jgi:hypothetical protein
MSRHGDMYFLCGERVIKCKSFNDYESLTADERDRETAVKLASRIRRIRLIRYRDKQTNRDRALLRPSSLIRFLSDNWENVREKRKRRLLCTKTRNIREEMDEDTL